MLWALINFPRLAAVVVSRMYWMNPVRKVALAANALIMMGYAVLSTPVAWVLIKQTTTMEAGVTLTLSSLMALLGYQFGGFLCDHMGARQTCLTALPFYMGNIAVFLSDSLSGAWITFGFINGVIYTAVDALFGTSIAQDTFGEQLAWRKLIRKNPEKTTAKLRTEFTDHRFRTAFTTSSMITYVAVGLGTAVGVWLANLSQTAWVLLPLILTSIAYALIWALPVGNPTHLKVRFILWFILLPCVEWKRHRQPQEQSWKARFHLYAIASPYLGVALANATFLTYLPTDPMIGIQAGLILMVAKLTNGFAYLLIDRPAKSGFRWSVWAMVIGMLLVMVGRLTNTWLLLPLCVLAAMLIGGAMAVAKLTIKLRLQHEAHASGKIGSATTPQTQMSEIGYLIVPIAGAFLIQEWGYPWLWVSAVGCALVSLIQRKQTT